MNNHFKGINSKEVKNQLKSAEVQKDKLIKNIYKEYELYFKIVRNSLLTSAKKGIFDINSNINTYDKALNSGELNIFLSKNITTLLNSKLPLITIEQLKLGDISDTPKQSANLDFLNEFLESKEYQIVNIDYGNDSIYRESLEFYCNNNSNTYEYYESLNGDELSSVNLDENSYLNSFSNQICLKKNEYEKDLVESVTELIEENNNNNIINKHEKINHQVSDVFISNDNLKSFEIIDKSFSNFLLDLSYMINSELYQLKIIKNLITEDTFKCLLNNNYMIKHPHPFVINFELNLNQSSFNKNKSSDIYLFNINNVELEFYNLDLSICRNHINELKNNFRLLNKKHRYWKKKELNTN